MKHFSTFVSMFLLLLMGGVQTATAQDDSDWENYAQDPNALVDQYVYLYNVTQHAFLNAGGNYGMNSIMNERGIRLTLERDSEGDYNLRGPIINTAQGAYLGFVEENGVYPVYVDRANADTESDKSNDFAKIDFVLAGNNTYYIRNQKSQKYVENWWGGGHWETVTRYWNYDGNRHAVYAEETNQRSSDVWCLISINDYRRLTQKIAQVGNYNVSGLLYNTRFIRNVSDEGNLFWKTTVLDYLSSDYCTAINPKLGTNESGINNTYAQLYGSYGCLEIGRATGTFYQEVEDLRPGLYKVSAQAFFDLHDDAPYTDGAYDEDNTATATNAYLFANDNKEPIPALTDDQYDKFMAIVNDHYDQLKEEGESSDGTPNRKLFRRNVPASVFMTGDNTFAPDESKFVVEVFVMVGSDGKLSLGVGKDKEGGRVYMDNMTLTYMGNPQEKSYGFGVDAYGDYSAVDPYTYSKDGYVFYLSRKFVGSNEGNGWNSLTLPVDLSSSQLRRAFGTDMKLVKLVGLNPQNTQQILFKPVDLSGGDGLEAGECYLVKVTNGPVGSDTSTEGNPFTFNRIDERKGPAAYNEIENVTYHYGYVYSFEGVSCPGGISNGAVSRTTDDLALKWTTHYYHPSSPGNSYAAPEGSYVMSGGNMYHLNSEWSNGLIGTAWYIEETNPTAGTKTLVIDNGNGTTDINGIVTETPAEKAAEGVYTINGQKIASDKSLNDLPKGIYIVNGKKHIVR